MNLEIVQEKKKTFFHVPNARGLSGGLNGCGSLYHHRNCVWVGNWTAHAQQLVAYLLMFCMQNCICAILKMAVNYPLSQIWLLLIHGWSVEWMNFVYAEVSWWFWSCHKFHATNFHFVLKPNHSSKPSKKSLLVFWMMLFVYLPKCFAFPQVTDQPMSGYVNIIRVMQK